MSWRAIEERRNWLPLLLTFVLGLLVGWWVLGWWLLPVTYTNALPQDLRADAKGDYLLLVADSYAMTGDPNAVQARVLNYGWPQEQLANDLSALQTRLGQQNAVGAQHVQQLAAGLNVAKANAPAASGAAAPVVAPSPSSGENQSLFSRVVAGVLWVVLVLAGIAAIAFLWQRWRQSQSGSGSDGSPFAQLSFDWGRRLLGSLRKPHTDEDLEADPALADSDGGDDGQFATPWEPVTSDLGASFGSGVYDTADLSAGPELAAATRSGYLASADASADPALRPGSAVTALPAKQAGNGAGKLSSGQPAMVAPSVPERFVQVGEYTATYYSGEPDYDEAFDIRDAQGVVVGQCGLSLMMPIGRSNDQAAALQVWLWEERDQYTQIKVLMSEGAYRDTALRDQLADDNPAQSVRQGSEFDLDTHKLRLHGIIDELAYADQEPYRQIFSHLAVRMQVFQRE